VALVELDAGSPDRASGVAGERVVEMVQAGDNRWCHGCRE
jgi:hypothetical protein